MELGIGHLILAAVSGGTLTPIVQKVVSTVTGRKSFKTHINERLDKHIEEDAKRFEKLDLTYTDVLMPMKEDIAYIKGKLSK